MTHPDASLLPLIARYSAPVTRLVSFLLLDKAAAGAIVMLLFEDLYDSGQLYEGAHFRAALLQRIKWACILANKLAACNSRKAEAGNLARSGCASYLSSTDRRN